MSLSLWLQLACDVLTFIGVIYTIGPTHRILSLQSIVVEQLQKIKTAAQRSPLGSTDDFRLEIADAMEATASFDSEDRKSIIKGLGFIAVGFFLKLLSYI